MRFLSCRDLPFGSSRYNHQVLRFLFFFTLAIPAPSYGSIHIEPYVGYGMTFSNSKALTDKKESLSYFLNSHRYKGVAAGSRLGYSKLGLAMGVDLSISQMISTAPHSALNPHAIQFISPGVFIGYNLPILFRVYATYMGPLISSPVFTPRIQVKNLHTGETQSCQNSRGFKLGFSYLSIPFLSVNFEYQPYYLGKGCSLWSHSVLGYVNLTI